MYLKQIEIHGFKSFANDTILTFEKGITGIVGPNGSGKSNIADAVRWVLGERSMKQLRGADTQDVIFSGTEMRKAQSFAYVSLIINNEDRKLPLDFDEVQVSRRLYRSGESEYQLNNIDCRLKDVNELFYDTGIGKEGYSIIGQGQIDKILSNKPEDRRELFDEAVGIVKYKRRKIIAEKKLEEEKLNLSRVTDIINEIERQIGPLRKQAEAAKKYLDLKDDLLLYESNYFIREVDNEADNINDISKKIDENKIDIKNINEEKRAFNEKYNEIEKLITTLDIEISEIKDNITNSLSLKENLKGQINVLKEQINSETNSNQGRIDRINYLNKSISTFIEQIQKEISEINNLKSQIEFINKYNNEVDEQENIISKDLIKINKCIVDVENLFKLVNDESFELDIEQNKFDNNAHINDIINVDSKRNELNNIDKDINSAKSEINDLNNKLIDINDKLQNANNDFTEKQSNFHVEETKLDTLKNMLERYEGYTNTVKNVMDNKNKFNGIKGVVADLIEAKKDQEIAIEVALGNSIQNIVTDNVETSKNIISYLRDNKLGRVTTLPLTAIEVKDNNVYQKAKNDVGVLDIAVNLVKYKNEYKVLADYLLQRCLIVDTFDHAKDLFKKYNSGIKIVTLQGELFNPGGAISGGAFKNSSNLLGRKREYDEALAHLSILKNEIDNLAKTKLKYSEMYDDYYNKIEKLKDKINELNINKNTITLNIINEIKLQYSTISNKVDFALSNIDRLIGLIKENIDEKDKYKNDDSTYNTIITSKENEITTFEKQISEIDIKLEEYYKEIDNKTKQKNDNLSNRREYYDYKDKITNRIIELEQIGTNLNNEIEKSNHRIEEITQSMFENYELTYVAAKEKYNAELGSSEEIKKVVKEKRKIIQELGPINIDAVEEYEKIGDRYDLMTTQYEDIKKSEEMIANIVKSLDDSMKKQFEDNFSRIKIEFEKVFKQLFGGGEADLKIIETNNEGVLDAGVAIVVQPPGKKLGNMMQLSGGEKALTAIALLFAIQNLKPSPFCLLDEIEAALDESNVDRYAEYLKNLTEDTQFILITHRRGTMEKADRLYGITMQEKGVTALVSVDLVEDQLT